MVYAFLYDVVYIGNRVSSLKPNHICFIFLHICSSPIADYPFYMLVETSGSHADHDEEKLNAFLENTMSAGSVLDGTVTNEPGKMQVRVVDDKQNSKFANMI